MWTLLDDLDAFLQEHRHCGELDGGVEGEGVWMTCECGAAISRVVVPRRGGRSTEEDLCPSGNSGHKDWPSRLSAHTCKNSHLSSTVD